ncbi:MAG: hypothetical protein KDJ65_29560 [Anaerolineae bacterium]|nr:hypothetical protein [Anaerolineae bacterium]
MERENAIFAGSRLYRQAKEGSETLLFGLQTKPNPLEPTIKAISNKKSIYLSETKDSRSNLTTAHAHLRKLSKNISPYIAVPILVQAITDFYYNDFSQKNLEWLGTALKIALSFIWKNVHRQNISVSKSVSDLEDVIVAAAVYEQLFFLNEIHEVYGQGDAELRGNGFYTTDDNIWRAFQELYRTFEDRGKAKRSLIDSTQVLNLQPAEALHAIYSVLSGESPKEQIIFKDTIFELIPESDPPEFWAGLWVRLLLMIRTFEVRRFVTDNPFGIALFETHAVAYPKGMDSKLIQLASMHTFWNVAWYKKRIRDTVSNVNNMIVERPLVRVSSENDLFVTSSILIADSINWFVEESIMRYPNRGGVPLSDVVFRKGISESFEIQVRRTLARFLFITGYVNEKGVWFIEDEDKHFPLVSQQGIPMPGEIDVLAYHPVTYELLVIECKVLGMPFSKQKLRNVISKVGKTDEEGFHRKLGKKLDWLKSTDVFSFFPVSQFIGLIVLDRIMPGMEKGEFGVVNFDILEKYLAEAYSDFS